MKDEIKEIFDIWADDDGEIVVHYIDKNNNKQEYKMITREDLLDYITNLQEKVEQYENPEDMTLFYMWLDEKTKDKMKKLQEENNNLKKDFKRHIDRINELTERSDNLQEENERLNNIIDELEKYIKDTKKYSNMIYMDMDFIKVEDILNKLKKLKEGK